MSRVFYADLKLFWSEARWEEVTLLIKIPFEVADDRGWFYTIDPSSKSMGWCPYFFTWMCLSDVQVNMGMCVTSVGTDVCSEKKIETKINLVEIMKESTVLWFGGVRPDGRTLLIPQW